MVKDVPMSSECSAQVDKTPHLQSPPFLPRQSLPNRVVLQSLKFGSLD